MPIIRRALTVAAVTAVGTLAFALPAWAHTGSFDRVCGHVTMDLTAFGDGSNTVHVFRNGVELKTVTFTGKTDHETFDEVNTGTVTYKAEWFANETSDHNASSTQKEMGPPTGCDTKPAPPSDTTTATPTNTVSAPKPPATKSATPSPTPSPAVEAAKLANTGAGNTVPLLVIGTVLVAGGVGLTFVTRRRRSGSTSS